MNRPVQLDLFENQLDQSILNGMYYERSSGKFVSYVLGRRHFEVSLGQCLGDKEWKERIMRERAI
ncbi:hypothetical protein AWU65_07300 [Paenibacillus glucanolyticus]|uniref:Uncharacterized protein n=1 Tax=Paenibacillus glucanolyticus TaxID=59843 RepID=A0A163I014_9BACL|nr:hypothetical protein [Paenibacillus glucanolyticus]KZS45732.1 hypothetical protein AWU65_07300 [Paenibacillus glucanolyticus]